MIKKKMQVLCALVAGISAGAALDAAAVEGFVVVNSTAHQNPNTGYAYHAYEYRYNTTQSKSLKCSSAAWDSAPIVVSFGGADGTFTDSQDTDLGRLLSNACVRLVAVKGVNGYLTGAPALTTSDPDMARRQVAVAGQNMGFVVDAALGYYTAASHVTVKGGSASAAYGAKMLEQRYASLGTSWTRVRRFVFGGPPIGDLTAGCLYTAPAGVDSTGKKVVTLMEGVVIGHTGHSSCSSYLASRNYAANPVYATFNATQLSQLAAWGVKVNTFVGGKDDFFGLGAAYLNCAAAPYGSCWSGPQGVENYLTTSGLYAISGGVVRRTITDSRTKKFASSTENVSFTTMSSMDHGLIGQLLSAGICDVVASGRANTNPAACYDPGRIAGVIDSVQNNTIYGWACASGSPYSIAVHVYVGGPAGSGTIVGGFASANGSETAVANACGSFGTAYRFAIPLSLTVRQAHVGKRIYIHGIHPTGTYANDLIANSGVFSVPSP